MLLAIDDYVYVNRKGLYGRIVNKFKEGEETFYTVTFFWDFVEDKSFKESELTKLEELDFPLGSIVTGLKGAKIYNFTTDKAIMKVVAKKDGGRILVEIIHHEDMPSRVNSIQCVSSRWFKLVQPSSNFIR